MYLLVTFLLTAGLCLSGGYWVETEWLYNLHPAATLGVCILTYVMMPNMTQPNVIQKTHDHRLYKMYIMISRENELRFKRVLEKLEIEDPVDD